ncbi:MAG: hypothetical protein NTW87_03600 [Planctomycetota bacterium]|nr:hypothetical protein [Planctomycetota bacterium]
MPVEEAAPPSVQVKHAVIRPGDPEWVRAVPGDGDAVAAAAPAQAAPQSRPRVSLPADPEWVRGFPSDGDAPPAKVEAPTPSSSPRVVRVSPGDPEAIRKWAGADADEPAEVVNENQSAQGAGLRRDREDRTTTTAGGDRPRFASGEGLDSDAAEVVADIALAGPQAAQLPRDTEDNATKAADAADGDATGKAAAGADDTAKAAANEAEAGAKVKKSKKKAEPLDPQKQYEELIQLVKKNRQQWSELTSKATDPMVHGPGGAETGIRVRNARAARALEVLLNDKPLGTIAGIITEGPGKQPVAARVRITDSTDTTVEAPLAEGFWCPGQFSVKAVSGPVKIEVSRGRFYPQCIQGVEAKAKGVTPCEMITGRPGALNFAAQGWYLADLDIGLGVRPGERGAWLSGPPSMNDLALAAQAEGVQILGVPVPWGESKSEEEVAAQAAGVSGVLLLPVFPGPRHAFYGCGMGLGVKSWTGLPAEISVPETPLCEAFEEIRARGGVAVYRDLTGGRAVDIRRDVLMLFPHLMRTGFYAQPEGTARLYAANELPFDTVAGPAYDVLDFDGSPYAERLWFNLLNQGYMLGVIGAGGGSLEGGRLPYGQTFINVEGKPTRENVLEAIRKGRTGISFGPAVFCKIVERDKGPGSVLPADGRGLTLQIQAYAPMTQGAQLERIEIIRNGEVVQTHPVAEGESLIGSLSWSVSETSSAWYVVRVTERRSATAPQHKPGTAWTSPIFFRGPSFSPPTAAVSRVSGTLHRGLTPAAGTVTAIVPGSPPRQVATDNAGRFRIELPASGSLVFEVPGCEPVARRVFEHPRVQRALGTLQAEREGTLRENLEKPSLFPAWRLLLSELNWDISVWPSAAKGFEPAPSARRIDSSLRVYVRQRLGR